MEKKSENLSNLQESEHVIYITQKVKIQYIDVKLLKPVCIIISIIITRTSLNNKKCVSNQSLLKYLVFFF